MLKYANFLGGGLVFCELNGSEGRGVPCHGLSKQIDRIVDKEVSESYMGSCGIT